VLRQLAACLSDKEFRSGEAISEQLGCSRIAVWKHIQSLRNVGIEIDAVDGQGYRLKQALELLDTETILAEMDQQAGIKLSTLKIEASVDSSNSALQRLPLAEQHGTAILAEHQTSGRGRRGRQWHSPFGRNVYLSLGWRFEQSLSELGCLPLVVALSAAEALSRAGLEGHCLKWPNDVLLDGKKLCGCLVEVQGDAHGPCNAVLGVGVNVHMPATAASTEIDQPWTDLSSQLPNCSRNKLAALLLEELLRQVSLFAEQGFAPFKDRWQRWDGLYGQRVQVTAGSQTLGGTVKGIDDSGALLLDTGEQVLTLHSGEVSLRGSNFNAGDR